MSNKKEKQISLTCQTSCYKSTITEKFYGMIIAIDLGEKRVGIAITSLGIPQPHKTVPRDNLIETLQEIIKKNKVESMVIGLPLNMDGTKGDRAIEAERFAKKLKSAFKLPVILQDERLTTWDAQKVMYKMGKEPLKDKSTLNKISATLILEDYLSREKE